MKINNLVTYSSFPFPHLSLPHRFSEKGTRSPAP